MRARESGGGALKVLMLSHYFAARGGGIELVAAELAQQLRALGIEVTWLATGTPDASGRGRHRAATLPASLVLERLLAIPYPVLMPAAWRLIFREARGADVVLVHDALYLSSVAGFLASRLHRRPLVVVQHVGLVPYQSTLLRVLMRAATRLIARPMLRLAARVIFISQLTMDSFSTVRWCHAPILIFNGVDTAVFSPPESAGEVEEARGALKLPLAAPVVLFVGRFVEKKGLAIMERVARQHADLVFAFAGRGPLSPARWQLPNVRVYDSLSGPALAALYRASDVLLLPSVGEGFPLVIQEALACGLRVICGADTARADASAAPLLRGLEVDLHQPEATAARFSRELSQSIAQRSSAAERRERFQFAEHHYSWKSTAASYAEILRALV